MGQYNYDVAKRVLSDTDKDRFLCCYLNMTDSNAVNWEKAAQDFGSASVASFKKTIANAFKKVKEGEAEAANGEGGEEDAVVSKAKGTGKKRKSAAASAAADDGEDAGTKASPKKKGKKGKKQERVEAEAGSDGDDAGGVKVECAEEM